MEFDQIVVDMVLQQELCILFVVVVIYVVVGVVGCLIMLVKLVMVFVEVEIYFVWYQCGMLFE